MPPPPPVPEFAMPPLLEPPAWTPPPDPEYASSSRAPGPLPAAAAFAEPPPLSWGSGAGGPRPGGAVITGRTPRRYVSDLVESAYEEAMKQQRAVFGEKFGEK